MGNLLESNPYEMEDPEDRAPLEMCQFNGYLLQKRYMPEEILILILSHVDPKDLVVNCRRVCKTWRNIIDHDVWRIKCNRKKIDIQKIGEVPWYVLYWLVANDVLNRNLIKNGCGQESMDHWEILSSGGNCWTVEKPPLGSDDFPKDKATEEMLQSNSCFATSYYSCSKKQVIDLKAEGAVPLFMDRVTPNITVSEWYAGRFDCRSVYELKVTLLDENADSLEEFEVSQNVGGAGGSQWEKVSHVFEDYPPGVRFVEFYHGGMDSQFWQGHYGSKMTGASVVLSLP